MSEYAACRGKRGASLSVQVILWFALTVVANINLAEVTRTPGACYTPLRMTACVLLLQATSCLWYRVPSACGTHQSLEYDPLLPRGRLPLRAEHVARARCS